ncbi:MAG: pyridoxal phosphate-dependent aminotransferase [Bdellovibrionota bacterium]
MLSKVAENLKPSPTLFLVARAKELQAQGHPVISLTVGEPDWPTFPVPSQAGIEAIQKNITKYTAASGSIELRKVIAEKVKKDLGVPYAANEITVGSGAKFIIFAALQMVLDPGDEVILHSPYWVSYPTMVELAGGVPKIVFCDEKENYKMSAAQLEKAITPKTKAFLFCSPSNPTGLMYSKEELKAFAEVLRKHPKIVILSDDIYNSLVLDGSGIAPHLLHVAPEFKDRLVAINGGSKAYSMTGWRIGWAAGPQRLIQAMGDYQSQTTGAPSSIAQHALLAAIPNCDKDIKNVIELLQKRKALAIQEFKKIPEMKISQPDGAFYLWVNIKSFLGKKFKSQEIKTDKDFAEILLTQFFVATVPGTECGNDGYLRLSFATSEENMRAAVARILDFTSSLS